MNHVLQSLLRIGQWLVFSLHLPAKALASGLAGIPVPTMAK
jgi:hypothetical protein